MDSEGVQMVESSPASPKVENQTGSTKGQDRRKHSSPKVEKQTGSTKGLGRKQHNSPKVEKQTGSTKGGLGPKRHGSPKVGKQTGSTKGLGRRIMNTIRKLQGQRGTHGATLASIKSFLTNEKNVDAKEKDVEIKMYLKNALDRGQLIKEAGSYKVAKRAQNKSNGGRKRSSVKASTKQRSRKLAGPKNKKNTGKPKAKKSKSLSMNR